MTTVMELLLVVSIAVGAAGAILAWRERPEPGALPLAALLVAQCWWSATLYFRIQTTVFETKVLWLDISWIGVPFIPVAWLAFSLAYTGNSQYLRGRYLAAVLVIPVITALLAVTNRYHTLLHVSMELVEVGGRIELARTVGPWYWVIAGYTYLLGLLGAIPLLQFVSSDLRTFRGQSLAILVGLFVPWVTNFLFLLGALPTGAIDPTPVAFSVSGVAYLGALTRFNLFGTSPTPIRPARRSAFDRARDGIVVLDGKYNVVDLNDRAGAILDAEPDRLLGRPVGTVLPELDVEAAQPDREARSVYRPQDGTEAYDVTRSRVADAHGRHVGELITLHDISDYLRQQQRLEVVNRVLRHNIRSAIQVILGNAEALAVEGGDPRVQSITTKANEIDEYTEDIRQILDLFERGRRGQPNVPLDRLIENAIDSLRTEYPEVTVHADIEADGVRVEGLLEEILWNVLENAARHNTDSDPELWITADVSDDDVQVVVEDNGPGIQEDELALLREGAESPLRHGSGVGLAIVVWGTELVGGDITFARNDPSGTVVTLEIPRHTEPQPPL